LNNGRITAVGIGIRANQSTKAHHQIRRRHRHRSDRGAPLRRQGWRGRSIWHSCSKENVTCLRLGLITKWMKVDSLS